MWFLKVDIMLFMLALCVVSIVIRYVFDRKQKHLVKWLPIIDIALLLFVSKKLAVFYVAYVIFTYILVSIIFRIQKRFLFVVFCFLCIVPLCYFRFAEWFSWPTYGLMLVGFSYNMLKAIDAIYYTYYTEEKIPFLMYLNFILFFPVLTAGPIFRYRDFKSTVENPEPLQADRITLSMQRMIRGMFKKVVLQTIVMAFFSKLLLMGEHFWVSILAAFTSYLILYLDMSGYADVAIGMGYFMGINVPENFKNPLKAPSFTQFWHTWHITLSDWIREHIFVVLNGKRLSKVQGAIIGWSTMVFMSVWHSFSPIFLIEGCCIGLVLAIENLFSITTVNRRKVKKSYFVFRCAVTSVIFSINCLIYCVDTEQFFSLLRGFFSL